MNTSFLPVGTKAFTLILILCSITSAARFAIDSFIPSIPALSQALNISGNDAELMLTLYMLGFGSSQLIYGPLSDYFGRKLALVSGLIIFLIANTLCAFSDMYWLLLIGRFMAGVGMGACGTLNRAVASDCFSGPTFSKVWSYTTSTLVIVLALAPFIGSLVQESLGWQANLLMGTFYVGCLLLIVKFKLPETNIMHRVSSLHIKAIVNNYWIIIKAPNFLAASLCYTFAFAGLIAYFQTSSLLLINVFKFTPVEYGWTAVLIATCYLIGGQVVNALALKVQNQRLILVGISLILFSGLLMGGWNQCFTPSSISILLPVCIYVIGARIIIPNAVSHAFTHLRHLSGSTSGMLGAIQMLGAGLISLFVSQFDFSSPFLLASVFVGLGFTSLLAVYSKQIKYLFQRAMALD